MSSLYDERTGGLDLSKTNFYHASLMRGRHPRSFTRSGELWGHV